METSDRLEQSRIDGNRGWPGEKDAIRKGGAQGGNRYVDEFIPDENRHDESSGPFDQRMKTAGYEGLFLFPGPVALNPSEGKQRGFGAGERA